MESAKRPRLSLIVLCLGTFAVLLDGTIVNVASRARRRPSQHQPAEPANPKKEGPLS